MDGLSATEAEHVAEELHRPRTTFGSQFTLADSINAH